MNAEKNSTRLYLAVGLVISLGLSLMAFEWRSFNYLVRELVSDIADHDEIVMMEIKIIEEKKPQDASRLLKPIPDVPKITDDVKLVDDLKKNPEAGPGGPVRNPHKFTIDDEEPEGDDEIVDYIALSDYPVYPGCENSKSKEEFLKCFSDGVTGYISANYRVPEDCKQWSSGGRIMVKFVLGKDGKIESAEVLKGIWSDCDREAERIVKLLPKMTPGKQSGHAVRTSFVVPITVKIR